MLKSAFKLAARCVFLWNLTLYQRQMVGDRSNPFHEMAFISALSSNRLNWRRYYGILKLRRKKEVSSEIPRPPGSTKFNLSLNFHTSIYHVTRQNKWFIFMKVCKTVEWIEIKNDSLAEMISENIFLRLRKLQPKI